MPSASPPFPVPDPERPLPSVTRQAFSAMYRKSRLAAVSARARCTMPPLEVMLNGTDPSTRFELEGTMSGGDETNAFARWGWEATIGDLSGRVRACFLVPHARLHEVFRG